MKYTKINLDQWDRGELFQFYMEHMRIVMSLTVDVDVTRLIRFTRQSGLNFYGVMVWTVSKVVNAHDEFKYGWSKGGDLIRWEVISPSYVHFHPEDQRFTKLFTPFSPDLASFHAQFLADKEAYRDRRDILPGQAPNFFDVSCLPWVRYRHCDLHVFDDGRVLAPVVTWGKYEEEQGRWSMPLTMNLHHAVADGFHLCRFFQETQELIDTLA